ncbi:MAG: Tol-Pal system beta propeller repeat protein TolB, partial [Desulfobacterales bacterium]|nr:Tol-Pal system beta propeller repeat protein TolB [Desulfobacterales bacterium]
MSRNKKIFLFVIVFLAAPALCFAKRTYISIDNPFLYKIPLAVPVFKAQTGNEAEKKQRRTAADLLSDTLAFSGYFKILDRGSFLIDPENPHITPDEINFRNWAGIGADFLITGGLKITSEKTEMELRLIDVVKGKAILGKRYTGSSDKARQRRIIRRFCTEVVFLLFGNRGVFDSKIAFVSNGPGNKEIFICDFDGYNPKRFTKTGSVTLMPAWSSDGSTIAYTSYAKGNPDLYIKNRKRRHGVRISRKGLNVAPAWVPGRFALAATLSFSGDPEIYMLTGKGKIIKRLTHNRGNDVSASFSPDGKKMAFVSNRAGSPQIYIKELASGVVWRLTFQGRYNTQPAWSPRGDKIVYTAMSNGHNDIVVIGVDGSNPLQLTFDSGNNESPTWSPDGTLIA